MVCIELILSLEPNGIERAQNITVRDISRAKKMCHGLTFILLCSGIFKTLDFSCTLVHPKSYSSHEYCDGFSDEYKNLDIVTPTIIIQDHKIELNAAELRLDTALLLLKALFEHNNIKDFADFIIYLTYDDKDALRYSIDDYEEGLRQQSVISPQTDIKNSQSFTTGRMPSEHTEEVAKVFKS